MQRNDDSRLIAIIESIKTVGPRNCSLISRMTGIPTETVRYKIAKQLIRKGILFRPIVDFELMGLKRAFVTMNFEEEVQTRATEILNNLHPFGLTYYARTLPNGTYVTMFAMPYYQTRLYEIFFERLVEEKVLRSFEISPVDYVQSVSLRPEYYDFKKGDWKIDWDNLVQMGIRLSNEEAFVPKRDRVKIDFIDLLIVHEMQRNAFFKINQLQKSLNINSKVLRYHFISHLVKNKIIAGYAIYWNGLDYGNNRVIGIIVKVKDVSPSDGTKLQEIFLKLPFSWNYAYSSRTRTFYLMLFIPSEYYAILLSNITDSFARLNKKIESITLDYKNVRSFTIPIALYDKELNEWAFNEPKALAGTLEILKAQKAKI
ncbi:MAG: hypothetical protein JTT12_07305 [Candidatus Brockarchaeota archaeon]|nr:hypothetical protein [Candidatus Brockarchaeota archaeon]